MGAPYIREGLGGAGWYPEIQAGSGTGGYQDAGLSGLEVIQEVKNQGFTGHFLIRTGYSEFEYAKSAISMGWKATC